MRNGNTVRVRVVVVVVVVVVVELESGVRIRVLVRPCVGLSVRFLFSSNIAQFFTLLHIPQCAVTE